MPFLASKRCFRPLTASMTSEVKNNYAYVITQDICNKFIEVNLYVGCIVLEPNRLLQRSTTMSLINKILGVTNIFLESRFVIPVKVHVLYISFFFSGISLHQYRSIWIPTRSCSKCGIENSPRILKRTFQ